MVDIHKITWQLSLIVLTEHNAMQGHVFLNITLPCTEGFAVHITQVF